MRLSSQLAGALSSEGGEVEWDSSSPLAVELFEAMAVGQTSYYVRPPGYGSARGLPVKDPHTMHVLHGMPITPKVVAKGLKGADPELLRSMTLPRLVVSVTRQGIRLAWRFKGEKEKKKTFSKPKAALKHARKILGQLRDRGDDFAVLIADFGMHRVEGGNTLDFAKAQREVKSYFRRFK